MRKRNRYLQLIVGLAFLSEILYLLLAALGDLRKNVPVFLLCYGALFILYLIAANYFFGVCLWGGARRRRGTNSPQTQTSGAQQWYTRFVSGFTGQEVLSGREILIIGVTFGILFRLTLLFTTPSLSDDIYRYIWDGKTAAHGVNPYRFPPAATALDSLKDQSLYPNINHKEVSTVYPPVSQLAFRLLYEISPTVTGFKAGFFVLDLLTIALLVLLMRAFSLNVNRVLLYAWNPLLIVEISGSGHADMVGIFLLTLALYFLILNKPLRATVFLAFSFLTKFIAALFLPLLALLKKENKLAVLLLFTVLTALLYLPFADAGEQLFSGLTTYTAKWQFNGSIFSLLLEFFSRHLPKNLVMQWMIIPEGMSPDPHTLQTRTVDLALIFTKISVIILFAVVYFWYLKKFQSEMPGAGNVRIFDTGLVFLGTFILINPTVHPWYLCWLLPLLVVVPRRAWIWLTGLVALAYWIFIDYTRTGVWQENVWVKVAEYVPFYGLLLFDALRNRLPAARRTGASPTR